MRWALGLLLIFLGILWAFLNWYAASMADRQVATFSEIVWPASWGLLPIAVGIAVIGWWR